MKDLQPINFPGLDPRRPLVIAGPCSAETEEQVIETARGFSAPDFGSPAPNPEGSRAWVPKAWHGSSA